MNPNRTAGEFVSEYGRTWETWETAGFVDLFNDEVVYIAHPTEETVVGKDALSRYVRKEQREQGAVRVRMGTAVVAGDLVAAEFWVMADDRDAGATIAGCFVARLEPTTGRCTQFREYWFEIGGHAGPFPGWGE